jgi:hypothetical protein
MPFSRNLETLTSWIPLGHSRPVKGLLYLYYNCYCYYYYCYYYYYYYYYYHYYYFNISYNLICN